MLPPLTFVSLIPQLLGQFVENIANPAAINARKIIAKCQVSIDKYESNPAPHGLSINLVVHDRERRIIPGSMISAIRESQLQLLVLRGAEISGAGLESPSITAFANYQEKNHQIHLALMKERDRIHSTSL